MPPRWGKWARSCVACTCRSGSTHCKNGDLPEGCNKGHIACWTVSYITILPLRSAVFHSNMLTFVKQLFMVFVTDLFYGWQGSEVATNRKKMLLTSLLRLHSSFQCKWRYHSAILGNCQMVRVKSVISLWKTKASLLNLLNIIYLLKISVLSNNYLLLHNWQGVNQTKC